MLRHPVYHVRVLRVDHRGDAEPAGGVHHVQDLVVSQLESFVGHVDLDAGDAVLLHHHLQIVLQDVLGRVGEDDVEAVVTVRLLLRHLVILLDHRHQTVIFSELAGEGDDRGRPSRDGTTRAGIVGVAGVVFEVGNLAISCRRRHQAVHRGLV